MVNYKDRPLIEYIPTVLKEIRQYQALTYGEQPEVFNLFAEIETALDNQFLDTATVNGISRWETMLDILPKGTDTLEMRRVRVKFRLSEQLPFTIRMLQDKLWSLCGENGVIISLEHGTYQLYIRVSLKVKDSFEDVRQFLTRVVPSNLLLDLSLDYNTHQILRKCWHSELAAFTHEQLRSEVLPSWNTHMALNKYRNDSLSGYTSDQLRRENLTHVGLL